VTIALRAVVVPTVSIDISEFSLRELRTCEDGNLDAAVQIVLRQVTTFRKNLGGSGPPGRTD
jgi:hypothetical protein